MRYLTKHGADVNWALTLSDKRKGMRAIHRAACGMDNAKIIEILLANGADIDACDEGGRTALMYAVQYNRIENVKVLLKHGANTKGALSFVFTNTNTKICELLLNAGADVNENGRLNSRLTHCVNPLYNAACAGNTLIGKFLLKHGAEPNIVVHNNRFGTLPLADTSEVDFAEALLKNGANVDGVGKCVPLVAHARETNYEMVKYLLKNGANPNAIDFYGMAPLHLAVQYSLYGLVKLLINAGADVNMRDETPERKTPLEYCKNDHWEVNDEIREALVKAGAH